MDTSTIRFDTAHLGILRQLAARIPFLQASIGDVVKLRLVVDANFVIAELIYRSRYPNRGATAFEELVRATVIDVFAPRWLDTEMTTSAIPKAARRSKVSERDLRARWSDFRALLKWDESLRRPGVASSTCCDPKDLPYVRLQNKLDADGILTRDADINRMGGHPLTLDFVLSTRAYARSAVTTISIRALGFVLPSLSLIAGAKLLKQLGYGFARLPEPIRAFIIICGITALIHPVSRKWLADRCSDALIAVAPALQALPELVARLAAINATAEVEASNRRQEVLSAIRPRSSKSTGRRRRVRTRTEATASLLVEAAE